MTEKTIDEKIGVTEAKIENLEASDEKQWSAIEKLQSRLPLWATVILMVMSGLVGSSLTYASLASRLISK
jgi:hypothetical protein